MGGDTTRNMLCDVASFWIYIGIYLLCTDPWTLNFRPLIFQVISRGIHFIVIQNFLLYQPLPCISHPVATASTPRSSLHLCLCARNRLRSLRCKSLDVETIGLDHSVNYFFLHYIVLVGARGSAVGWGTAQQAGRSRVRFPMVSLVFFIDIILPATLWSWGWLSL